MFHMLICNLVEERYKILKKSQFGLTYCTDTYMSMLNQQYGFYLNCSGVVLCYVPEVCTVTNVKLCDIYIQTINENGVACSSLTITKL